MIDTVLYLVFRCTHRRMTRPMTPVDRAGHATGETYVVCLDCGKQFVYDWNTMHMGKAVKPSLTTGVLRHDIPKAKSGKLKYAVAASAVFLIGKALWPKSRERGGVSHRPARGEDGTEPRQRHSSI